MSSVTRYRDYRGAESSWLNSVPAHWSVLRLMQVASTRTSNVDKHTVDGQTPVRLCNYTDVYKNDSITEGMGFMSATATSEQVARFRIARGDTIITKDSETADDIGVPAFVAYEAPDLVCGYHLAVVRPRPTVVDPRFLYWTMAARPTLRQWAILATGVTRVGLKTSDLARATVAVPPLPEQRAIADYLDRETAQIDALIGRQEQLIETLRERRVAVADRLAWVGLDESVPLTPSGVDTAPLAPAHWLRRRNKNVARERTSVSVVGAEELLSVSHLTGVTPRSEKNVTMIEAESLDGYRIVHREDLVINTMWAWMGALGVSQHDGIVSPAYGVYTALNGVDFEPRYYDYLYRSKPYVVEMTRHSRGMWTSRLRLYPESFLRLNVVVPPLEEQRLIADYLDERTALIDALIAKAEQFIELAKERRAALITAAVTGQIDVRTTTTTAGEGA